MMPDPSGRQEPPTYYANIVTTIVNVDELTLEFRRLMIPHRDIVKGGGETNVPLSAPNPEKIMQEDPIAVVVLTFTAAKSLKEYLDQVLPQVEQARREGRTL